MCAWGRQIYWSGQRLFINDFFSNCQITILSSGSNVRFTNQEYIWKSFWKKLKVGRHEIKVYAVLSWSICFYPPTCSHLFACWVISLHSKDISVHNLRNFFAPSFWLISWSFNFSWQFIRNPMFHLFVWVSPIFAVSFCPILSHAKLSPESLFHK